MIEEKDLFNGSNIVEYQATAPFEMLGKLTHETTDIWLVFHGFGQLAARFVRKFQFLDDGNQVIIAPQGPDRFYFDQFRKIGASWTTRDHRDLHLANQQNYLDAVWEQVTSGIDLNSIRIHTLGFSQGVSVQTRWISSRQIKASTMIYWAGGYPEDLSPAGWDYFSVQPSVLSIVGDEDEYLTDERMSQERQKVLACHPQAEFRMFSGKHVMPEEEVRKAVEFGNRGIGE